MVAPVVIDKEETPNSAWRNSSSLPIRTKLLVRTLYLVQGHTPKEIEMMGVGVTALQVSGMANREGWTQNRKAIGAKMAAAVALHTEEAAKRVTESLAAEAEELCFGALDATREGLRTGGLNGAKQAQAGSTALKNLVSVVQSIRKPEMVSADGKGTTNFNLFFSPAAPAAPAAKAVEQVIDVPSV